MFQLVIIGWFVKFLFLNLKKSRCFVVNENFYWGFFKRIFLVNKKILQAVRLKTLFLFNYLNIYQLLKSFWKKWITIINLLIFYCMTIKKKIIQFFINHQPLNFFCMTIKKYKKIVDNHQPLNFFCQTISWYISLLSSKNPPTLLFCSSRSVVM